jgi:undecaprenyl-diphosphatase
MHILQQIDADVMLFFNGMHCSYLDSFMMLFSGRFIWIGLYLSIYYIMYRYMGLRRATTCALTIAFTIALGDQLCATVIRPFVERQRPANPNSPIAHLVHIVDGYRGGKYGFPSCHAVNTCALATCIAVMFRRWHLTVAMSLWALLSCYSRIYLGVHYPGDLLVGAIIGIAIAYTCSTIVFRYLWRNDRTNVLLWYVRLFRADDSSRLLHPRGSYIIITAMAAIVILIAAIALCRNCI